MSEVTLAYGDRQVKKLIEILEVGESSVNARLEAIQLLCDISSCQEKKSTAVEEVAIGNIIMDLLCSQAVPELIIQCCKLIQSLGKVYKGRQVMKKAGVFEKLIDLIDMPDTEKSDGSEEETATRTAEIKFDAAKCIRQMSCCPDGVDAFLSVDKTIPVLVKYIVDSTAATEVITTDEEDNENTKSDSISTNSSQFNNNNNKKKNVKKVLDDKYGPAIQIATLALCGLAVRQNFLERALERNAHLPVIKILSLELDDEDINTACCTLLSHLCHHPQGKVAVLQANGLESLSLMLASTSRSVKQRATGAIAGLTIEPAAKMVTIHTAGSFLVRLVNDKDPIVASNALICLENCCEIPTARESLTKLLHEDTKLLLRDFICWPKPHDMKRDAIRPFPIEEAEVTEDVF